MGRAMEVLSNGHGTEAEGAPPPYLQCGVEMTLHDYRFKRVHGLEGDSDLERTHYVCPQGCEETLFL